MAFDLISFFKEGQVAAFQQIGDDNCSGGFWKERGGDGDGFREEGDFQKREREREI